MKLIDTIMAISHNRPVWENFLKFILFLWFAFANGVAVYGMGLALKDRKKFLAGKAISAKEVLVSIFGILSFIFFVFVTLLCIAGIVFALTDIF